MRKRNANRLSMIGSTITFCEQNSSAWAGIAAFAGVLNQVKLKKKEVDEQHEIASATTKGVTEDVRALRKNMTQLAVRCASATLALAHMNKNYDLAAQVNFTANKMGKMSKEKAAGRCQGIKDAALANLAALAGYGITAGDITELQNAINAYRAKIASPRLAIINRSKAKRKIAETIRFIIDHLFKNQLDPMAATVMFSNSYFHNGYLMAREIIDLGVVHTKLKAFVADQNGLGLAGARLIVTETATGKVVKTVVCDELGTISINPMTIGTFDFKWEAEGYVTKTEAGVHIAPGKVVRRKVTMRKG